MICYGFEDDRRPIPQAKMEKSWSKLGRTGIVPGGDGVPPYNHCLTVNDAYRTLTFVGTVGYFLHAPIGQP